MNTYEALGHGFYEKKNYIGLEIKGKSVAKSHWETFNRSLLW